MADKDLYPASDKDVDVIKGDSSESGSNSYAKNNQKSIDSLNKIYKRYKAAKDESSASTREKVEANNEDDCWRRFRRR